MTTLLLYTILVSGKFIQQQSYFSHLLYQWFFIEFVRLFINLLSTGRFGNLSEHFTQTFQYYPNTMVHGYWSTTDYSRNRYRCKRVRKYHNKVKLDTLNGILKPGSTVLDLCCGRGVDLYKYHTLRASYVYYVDRDKVALQHAICSYRKLYSHDFHMHFSLCDVTSVNLQTEIQRRSSVVNFDIVVIHMAIHYFLGSTITAHDFLSKSVPFVTTGGYFVFSGIDGHKLHNMLQMEEEKKLTIRDACGSIIAQYQALYTENEIRNTGQKISTFISSIGKTHEEYLLNFDHLIRVIGRYFGMILIEDMYFTDYGCPYIDTDEFVMSSLHRICIFKKIN